jgi:RimJ/RimL family protein N-acetyltransferase
MTRPLLVRGKKVSLAMMEKGDVPTLTRWNQDLVFTACLGSPGEAQTVEQRETFYERNGKMTDSCVELAIVETETGELVGFGGLFSIVNGNHGELFIGIAPEKQNGGYGREATRLICEYGFLFRNLWNIRLQVKSYNARAIKMYERVGFKHVGRLRGVVALGGVRYDEVLMDLVRDEFALEYLGAFVANVSR